jgi:cell shape-determining protein MreC
MRSLAVFTLAPKWYTAASEEKAPEQEQVRQWLLSEERIQEECQRLQRLRRAEQIDGPWQEFFARRAQELNRRLELQAQAMPATVIFREPASWSSALWIDVGEEQNKNLGQTVIAKNSPVLSGAALIGVVEYVGQRRSRVRLITDARLTVAVRALRGREQSRQMLEHLNALFFSLNRQSDLFSSPEEETALLTQLTAFAHKLSAEGEDRYLAKGELFGCSAPLWRSRGQQLRGVGFNYDFADEEGPARDLRSGESYDPTWRKEPIALLKAGDVLVTSGLDGVFPAGYRVALISKVQSLKEGASSYEIEATIAAGDLESVSHVTVLPSFSEEYSDLKQY